MADLNLEQYLKDVNILALNSMGSLGFKEEVQLEFTKNILDLAQSKGQCLADFAINNQSANVLLKEQGLKEKDLGLFNHNEKICLIDKYAKIDSENIKGYNKLYPERLDKISEKNQDVIRYDIKQETLIKELFNKIREMKITQENEKEMNFKDLLSSAFDKIGEKFDSMNENRDRKNDHDMERDRSRSYEGGQGGPY